MRVSRSLYVHPGKKALSDIERPGGDTNPHQVRKPERATIWSALVYRLLQFFDKRECCSRTAPSHFDQSGARQSWYRCVRFIDLPGSWKELLDE